MAHTLQNSQSILANFARIYAQLYSFFSIMIIVALKVVHSQTETSTFKR